MQENSSGFIVHVCNGNSKIGSLTIDKFTNCDVRGDMLDLPLKDGIADTVICDPPWGIPYHHRFKLSFEFRRILKLGGVLLLNCPWYPTVPGLELEQLYYRHHLMWDLSIITKFRRIYFDIEVIKRSKKKPVTYRSYLRSRRD